MVENVSMIPAEAVKEKPADGEIIVFFGGDCVGGLRKDFSGFERFHG